MSTWTPIRNNSLHYKPWSTSQTIGIIDFVKGKWLAWHGGYYLLNFYLIYNGDSLENAKMFIENYWILQSIKAEPWVNDLHCQGEIDFIGEL